MPLSAIGPKAAVLPVIAGPTLRSDRTGSLGSISSLAATRFDYNRQGHIGYRKSVASGCISGATSRCRNKS